jgi:hypothetical protein
MSPFTQYNNMIIKKEKKNSYSLLKKSIALGLSMRFRSILG